MQVLRSSVSVQPRDKQRGDTRLQRTVLHHRRPRVPEQARGVKRLSKGFLTTRAYGVRTPRVSVGHHQAPAALSRVRGRCMRQQVRQSQEGDTSVQDCVGGLLWLSLGRMYKSEDLCSVESRVRPCTVPQASAHVGTTMRLLLTHGTTAASAGSLSSRSASRVACRMTGTCGNMEDGRCMPSNATQYAGKRHPASS